MKRRSDMFARCAVALLGFLTAATSVVAEPLNAEQARAFVAGKLFAFTCFDGTSGQGRIYNDGSAAGVAKFMNRGDQRFIALPANTLRVQGEQICASVKGMFFEPCFNLQRPSAYSFRGSVSGMSFAHCGFAGRGGRTFGASNGGGKPLSLRPRTARSQPADAEALSPGEM